MKLCIFCKHISYFDNCWYGYESTNYSCERGHFSEVETDLESLQGWSLKAEHCGDYELDESAVMKGRKTNVDRFS